MTAPRRIRQLLLGALLAAGLVTGSVVVGTGTASAQDPAEFIAFAREPAQAGEREFGVPASVAIAQAALESAWGESSLTRDGNAYFGIKCGSDNGPISDRCVEKVTQECNPQGECWDEVALFRGYADATDSFRDHGHFLKSRPRYAAAFEHSDDPDQFIREVHRAGYATDPAYSDKIISLMRKYDLYQYDQGGAPSRPTLREGSRGQAVEQAQTLLNQKGDYGLAVDGVFGARTKAAVVDFQTRNGLTADGVIGPRTWTALES
ncbi:MAG TPA: glucosaminidase domain-containing protein [Microlunatus sp.]|nr:glucosaminidase domain-containing protein [Microlunatus sp.]